MIYGALLVAHIAAAVLTVPAALFGILKNARHGALLLGAAAGFEVLSGALLALLSSAVSASGLVGHIALYLGACLAVEIIFMRRISATPLFAAGASAPVVVGLGVFLSALVFGM